MPDETPESNAPETPAPAEPAGAGPSAAAPDAPEAAPPEAQGTASQTPSEPVAAAVPSEPAASETPTEPTASEAPSEPATPETTGEPAAPNTLAAGSTETTPEATVVPATEAESPPAEPGAVAAEPAASPAPDAGNSLSQDELDALSAELAGGPSPSPAAEEPSAVAASTEADADLDRSIAEAMAEASGGQATAAPAENAGPAVVGAVPVRVSPEDAKPFTAPELPRGEPPAAATIDLLDDVQLDVKIELGRTNMYIEDVLRLGVGSVVELDKLAGDPVDIYVNERLIARGEVLVLNDNFCVRINAIHSPVPELEPA